MRNLLLLFIPLLFSMCSNEITDKDEYEAKLIVTANPPIKAGETIFGTGNTLTVGGVSSNASQLLVGYDGATSSSDFSSASSDTYLISDGNFMVMAALGSNYDYLCSDITIELMLDGKSFDKRTATLGTDDMGAPCGNEISLSYNLILP